MADLLKVLNEDGPSLMEKLQLCRPPPRRGEGSEAVRSSGGIMMWFWDDRGQVVS